ncbi:hypothetical protein [Serratia marcescens]|uniref:hypothetical protein n=1 Tax=Serratia marcescens TaxID=615 RepID=UPI00321197A5
MIFPTRLLRAALVCVAKHDPRYYLEGVHITPKYIEATNGHVALRMEHGIKTRKDIIVKFDGAVPPKLRRRSWYSTKSRWPSTVTPMACVSASLLSGCWMRVIQTWVA